jgi:Tfp pilus assembly protein PilN
MSAVGLPVFTTPSVNSRGFVGLAHAVRLPGGFSTPRGPVNLAAQRERAMELAQLQAAMFAPAPPGPNLLDRRTMEARSLEAEQQAIRVQQQQLYMRQQALQRQQQQVTPGITILLLLLITMIVITHFQFGS